MRYLICATHRETGETAWLRRPNPRGEYSFAKNPKAIKTVLYTRDEATRLTSGEACYLLDLLENRFRHIDNDEADNAPWITDWRIVPARD